MAIVAALVVLLVVIAGAISGGNGFNMNMQSNSTSSWNQFLEYVATKEGGTKTADGQYYIVEDDSKGNPTVGHGLCLKSSDGYLNVDAFSSYSIDSKQLADNWLNGNRDGKVSVEICDAIWEEGVKTRYESIVAQYPDLRTYQHYALTDVKYRRGNTDGFQEAYNSEWTASDDKYGDYDESKESFSMDSLYSFFNNGFTDTSSGVYTRKQDQWILFKYGYYRPLGEYWKGAPNGADVSSLNTVDYKGTYQSNINGYTFVEYYQNGSSWSSDPLNGASGSTVGSAGCHVTSMAIALTAITGDIITPRDVNNAFNFMSNGDEAILNTLKFSYLKNSINISACRTSGLTKDFLISELNKGHILMIRFQGLSEWSTSTHYVICADYKKEAGTDYIYISNPNRYGTNGWVDISRITISQWTQARIISQK